MTTDNSSSVVERDAAFAQWCTQVETDLKGVPFEKKLVTPTREGIAVQPLYIRGDAVAVSDGRRGWRANAAGARSWEVAQRVRANNPAAYNTQVRAALMAGQDAVVLDLAAGGEPGWGAKEWRMALAGIDFAAVSLRVGGDERNVARRREFIGWAREHGIDLSTLRGSVAVELTDAAELAAWVSELAESAPALRSIGVDGRRWQEAGGSAVHELGFALASAVENLRELERHGVSPATAAAHLEVTFAIGPRFFTEVAKFRAWRILWTKVLAAAGAAEAAPACFVAAESGRRNKSRLDVHTNLLRITTEGLAAVLGGVDALQLAPHDELDPGPDARAGRVARNLHLLLGEEFHLTDTADPAGGCWYVESLTDELARAAWAIFQEVEKRGGLRAALAAGWPQDQVRAAATKEEKAVAQRRRGIIGTNLFPNPRDQVGRPSPAGECRDGLTARRLAEPFEALRWAAQNAAERPVVHLARVGTVKHYKARADFAAGFYAVGGFEIRPLAASSTAAAAAAAAIEAGARVVVLCSSDDLYPELVPAFAGAMRAAGAPVVLVLAGLPADPEVMARYREAGIEEFIHLKADVIESNRRLLTNLGVLS